MKLVIGQKVVCPGRSMGVMLAALFGALAFIALSTSAWGQEREDRERPRPEPQRMATQGVGKTDEDPWGNRYAAGELIVRYEDAAKEQVRDEVPEESGGRTEKEIPELDAELVSFPAIEEKPSEDVREQALKEKKDELLEDPAVEAVDYNYLRKPAYTPYDPYFSYLWGVKRIQAPQGWDRSQGTGARVAVVDSGIDYFHPEFSGKVYREIDFVDYDYYADDYDGHGTHVAGTIAANTDNGEGVSGTCPGCDLIVARALTSSGGYDSDIADAIAWSADSGADVINLSLGGSGKSSVLESAVNYAWNEGAVVVAAAGNESTNTPSYPAAYPRAIAVAATDEYDRRAPFSNYGSWVDVSAPGVNVLSTYIYDDYRYASGTSMAAPHVAGMAGLLASQGLSNSQIRRRIETTAVDKGAAGRDNSYGWGRVNAYSAITGEAPPAISYLRPVPGSKTRDRTPTIGATVKDSRTDLSKSNVTLLVDGKKRSTFSYNRANDRLSFTPGARLPLGKHTVKIVARDGAGISKVASWRFSVVR